PGGPGLPRRSKHAADRCSWASPANKGNFMPYDLFISYSRRDDKQGQVRALKEQIEADYRSFAYSALACFRMGMSGSASFQSVRKSLWAASARTRAASASAPCEVLDCRALARATPRCAKAPVQQFQTMPLWSMIFWNSAAAALPCPAARYASPCTYTG